MDQWRKRFITRLTELKKTDGMTQESLADLLGLSQGTIAQWSSGKRQPRNLAQFRALETALKLPAGALTEPHKISVSESLTKAISNIDYHLAEETAPDTYTDQTLDEIKAVRLIMENLRKKLDTPPLPDDLMVSIRLPYATACIEMTVKEARDRGLMGPGIRL